MKRFIAVLSGLLVLPAFAEVAPVLYDEGIEYSDVEMPADDVAVADEIIVTPAPVVQPARANPRGLSASGRVASRAIPSDTASVATTRRASNARATTPNVQARTTTVTSSPRGTVSRVASRSSRSATNATNQIATTRRAMQTSSANTARASIVQTDTVNAPLYTGRVSTRASGAMRARIPTISVASGTTASTPAATVADATAAMDELAQITDFCKAQYTQCMDNFCDVLDDNQGRCSCSKNVKNYATTEAALKEATEELQDVAQQIQYIGLSADEIETLFSETEAELQMNLTSDNTQLKNDLDKIRSLIVDVKSGRASSTETDMSFDLSGLLDFSIDSTGFDLASLFGTTTANTASISNQRGEQLYKTAASRCKAAVLNECAAQGVDISVISNSYDLEIDKQCIAYERSLMDTNDEMVTTVRNAKNVLQRARLMVAQQKNVYDLRGCVNALDSCMQDDYVCGSDYEYCLDPTGKYIVNGEIVIGSKPGQPVKDTDTTMPAPAYSTEGLYATWNFGTGKNAWSDGAGNTLTAYIDDTVTTTAQMAASDNMSKYLQYKIGYVDSNGKNQGMCMSVLNKCQDYTYSDKTYVPNNNVIKEYLSRTLVQIKAAQDALLADHAENCITDVASCLSSNNYSDATKNIAINACKSQIVTCMSVNGDASQSPTPKSMQDWVQNIIEVINDDDK